MAEQLVDGRGGRLDLMVRAGTDMPTVTLDLATESGTPMDLSGATVVCVASARGDAPVAMAIGATVVDAAAGTVAVDLDADEIARMEAPGNMSMAPRVGGDWSLDVVIAGRTVPVVFGQVYVGARVVT